VPATARAEQIDVAGFCSLARCYQAFAGPTSPVAARGTG
jgi:hypothetical protein